MNELKNEVYIGYNGAGKTRELERIYREKCPNPKKQNNIIYIPTEQNFKNELEKEKTSSNGNFIYLIKRIINKIFAKDKEFVYKINESELKKIKGREEYINKINNFFENIGDDDFTLKKNDLFKNKSEFNTLQLDLEKYESPSGKNNYSLIKILGTLLKYAMKNNIEIDGFQEFYLIIDEPEKFSHPNLIKKISIFLKEISNYINIILSTHSPLFLSYYVNNEKSEIFLHSPEDNKFKSFKIDNILKKLKFNDDKLIYRVLSNEIIRINFFETLFSKKIIIVEDITTKTYLNLIFNSIGEKSYWYSILISFGWNNIDDFIKFYLEAGVNIENIKIIIDGDEGKKESYLTNGNKKEQIIYSFTENIENELGLSGNNKTSASNLILKEISNLETTNSWIKIKSKLIKLI